jgi:hypothetical protein
MENDYQGTLDAFENIELVSDMQAEFVYPLMSMAALALEDFDTASDYLIRAKPNLDSDTNLIVNKYNLREAIMLAYILRQQQNDRKASALLSQAWDVVQQIPRLGKAGHGISDVHILAIQGRQDAALDALRQAVDEGFVSLMAYDYWTIDQDVLLDGLRADPRFEAIRLEIHDKIDAMRQNVLKAEDSGNWNELLGRVRGEVTASYRPDQDRPDLRL